MSLREKLDETERRVARGDMPDTSLLVLGGVTLVLVAVGMVVIAVALLLWIYA